MLDLLEFWIENLPWTEIGLTAGRILLIVVGAYLVHHYSGRLIDKLMRRMVSRDARISKLAASKRRDTLTKVLSGTVGVIALIVALLMVLQELGLPIGPVLAAAGVAGLAFGFGGQYLIRDLISGLFIIMENQYRVGDIVRFGDTAGQVEDITLRMTTLRDLDGIVHHIPHGEVKTTANFTKYFSRINIDIGIAYDSDLEHVITVVNKVGQEMMDDIQWKDSIKVAPHFLRIDDFADSAIIIKILGETEPSKQWDVAGEFRKRLKLAFDKEGVVIPFPQRVIHTA